MKSPWKWSLVEPIMFHLKLMRCLLNPAYGLGVRSGRNRGRYKEKVIRNREGKTRRNILSLMGFHDIWSRTTPDSLFWQEGCYSSCYSWTPRPAFGIPGSQGRASGTSASVSQSLRAWASTKSRLYSSLLHLCAWKAELAESQASRQSNVMMNVA